MLHFNSDCPNVVHLDLGAALPRTLTLMPSDVETDGAFTVRGMNSGRINTFDSSLTLAVALHIEANQQLVDLVTFDDVLTGRGPEWGSRIADRLDGGPAPTLLIRADIGGRIVEQAVTAEGKDVAADSTCESVESRFRYYREHGITWSLMTEDHVEPGRIATLLWLSRCLETPVPSAAKKAILETVDAFPKHVALSTILVHAAVVAGVSTPIILSAFGHLIAFREVGVDLDDGVIAIEESIGHSPGKSPTHISGAWLDAFRRCSEPRVSKLGLN